MELSEAKFIKIPNSLYDSGALESRAVENFEEWIQWAGYGNSKGRTVERMKDMHLLLQDNRHTFKRLFGTRNFTFKSEFFFHGWLIDLGTAKLIILTAKGKGTCYEVVTKWNDQKAQKDMARVTEFLDLLIELIPQDPQA